MCHNSLLVAPLIMSLGSSECQLQDVIFHQGALQALPPINHNRSPSQHLHCLGEIFPKLHFSYFLHTSILTYIKMHLSIFQAYYFLYLSFMNMHASHTFLQLLKNQITQENEPLKRHTRRGMREMTKTKNENEKEKKEFKWIHFERFRNIL